MSWEEYWNGFERWRQSLNNPAQQEIHRAAEEARKYVNGMTDGGYDYVRALEKLKFLYERQLDGEQMDQLQDLLDFVRGVHR